MRFLKLSQHCIPFINIAYINEEEEAAEEEEAGEMVPVVYLSTRIHLKNGEWLEVSEDFQTVSNLLDSK